MNADPEVMLDQGGPLSREKSDAKLDRYAAAFVRYGFCRWVIQGQDGEFFGYAGVMPSPWLMRSGSRPSRWWVTIGGRVPLTRSPLRFRSGLRALLA